MGFKLSGRLKALVSYVRPGEKVADIGTGHALLPIYLAKNNLTSFVVASEFKLGPYAITQKQVANNGVQKAVDVRLGDGLKVLKPGEVDVIIISGIGGENIIRMLDASPEILCYGPRLVLQPMTFTSSVRTWLAGHGWSIVDEDLIKDGKRYYEIVVAEMQACLPLTDFQATIGPILLQKKHPLLVSFLRLRVNQLKRVLTSLKQAKRMAERKQRSMEVMIEELERVISWLSPVSKF